MHEAVPTHTSTSFFNHICSFCSAASLFSALPVLELGKSLTVFGGAVQLLLSSRKGNSALAESSLRYWQFLRKTDYESNICDATVSQEPFSGLCTCSRVCSHECSVLPLATHRCLPLDLREKHAVPTHAGLCCMLQRRLISLVSDDQAMDTLADGLCAKYYCLCMHLACLIQGGVHNSISMFPHLLLTSEIINTYSTPYSIKNCLIATWIVNIKANSQSSCLVVSGSSPEIVAWFRESRVQL